MQHTCSIQRAIQHALQHATYPATYQHDNARSGRFTAATDPEMRSPFPFPKLYRSLRVLRRCNHGAHVGASPGADVAAYTGSTSDSLARSCTFLVCVAEKSIVCRSAVPQAKSWSVHITTCCNMLQHGTPMFATQHTMLRTNYSSAAALQAQRCRSSPTAQSFPLVRCGAVRCGATLPCGAD
jgi:hypothetical protein